MSDDAGGHLGEQNPWPGLRSFTEADSAYFFGRERETQALVEIVERSQVAVLYGQSGLGKTSLLRAGLFPRLSGTSHLPVWVRLDHSASAPPLARQVLDALTQAFVQHGVEAPAPRDDESLWSYFHRHDADFWGSRNRLVVPVIVLDQFEEMFTLGRRDAAAGARTEQLARELEAQFEQRPPAAVREHLERYPEDAAAYDPARETVRFIVSLREDYLPHLDAWRERMPSMLAHRFRLEQMTGEQALDVVRRAGGDLVDDSVARDIVGFVGSSGAAAGAVAAMALPQARIEPAILSVVCDELNVRRLRAGLASITPELLSGERGRIINDFYERAFVGIADPVRDWVEDELLTDSGHRDHAALEDARRAGIDVDVLTQLVDRRVLHSDERNQVVWLELTHDLLTEPALASRNARQVRRAEIETAQRGAAAAAKLRRSRTLTAVFATLFLLMSAGTWRLYIERETAKAERASAARARDDAVRQKTEAERLRGIAQGHEQTARAATGAASAAAQSARVEAARAQQNLLLAQDVALALARQGIEELEQEWLNPGYDSAEVLRATSRKMDTLAQQFASAPSMDALHLRSIALAAAVNFDRGGESQCHRLAARADALAREVAATSDDAVLALAMHHYASAQCLHLRRQLSQSTARYREAAQLASRLRADSPQRKRLLVLSELGQVQAALQHFDSGIARQRLQAARLLVGPPTSSALLAESGSEVAAWNVTLLLAEADLANSGEEQLEFYDKAQKSIRALRDEVRRLPAWRHRLISVDTFRAYALHNLGRDADAEPLAEGAMTRLNGMLVNDSSNSEWQLTSIRLRRLRAEIWLTWGRSQQVNEELAAVEKMAADMVGLEPNSVNARYLRGVSAWLQSNSKLLDANAKREKVQTAERTFAGLVHDAPEYCDGIRSWAIAKRELGQLALEGMNVNDPWSDEKADRQRLDAADSHFRDALRVMALLKHASTLRAVADVEGGIEYWRGMIAGKRGNREESVAALQRAVAYYRAVPETTANRVDRVLLRTEPSPWIASLQRRSGKTERATATDVEAVAILRRALEGEPRRRVELFDRMALVHRVAAVDQLRNDELEAAVRSQERAAEAMLEALQSEPLNKGADKTLEDIHSWVAGSLKTRVEAYDGQGTLTPAARSKLLQAVRALETKSDPARAMQAAAPPDNAAGSLAPALPGDWEYLDGAAMRAQLASEIARLRADNWTALRARQLRLPFYSEARLVEIDVVNAGGEVGAASLMTDADGTIVRFAGQPEPLKAYNADAKHSLNLRTLEQARLYVRVLIAARLSEYGMLRLIDNPRDLTWLPGTTDQARAKVERRIEPFQLTRAPGGDWTGQATAQIDNALFQVRLALSRDGTIYFFRYIGLESAPTLVSEQYWNGIRVTRHSAALSANVQELIGRKDWAGGAAMQQRLIADLWRPIRTDEQAKSAIAPKHLDLSWYWILAREPAKALDAADRGLKIDPDNLAVQMNRAHALVLLGRSGEAMDAYRRPLGKQVSTSGKRLWEVVVLEDLDRFEKEGLIDPRFADVRALMRSASADSRAGAK